MLPPTAIRVRLLSFSIPRTRRRLRSSLHRSTSKKRWRRLVFWTPRQSISLNQSIKHCSDIWHRHRWKRLRQWRRELNEAGSCDAHSLAHRSGIFPASSTPMRATLFTNVLADSSQDRLRLEGASLDQINQTTRTISRYDLICTITKRGTCRWTKSAAS